MTILLDGHAHEYRTQLPGPDAGVRQQAVAFIYQARRDLLGQRQATEPRRQGMTHPQASARHAGLPYRSGREQ